MRNDLLAILTKAIAKEVVDEIQSRNLTRGESAKRQVTKLINTKDAAQYYGVCVGTIRNWVSKGELESKRIGSRLFVVLKTEKDA